MLTLPVPNVTVLLFVVLMFKPPAESSIIAPDVVRERFPARLSPPAETVRPPAVIVAPPELTVKAPLVVRAPAEVTLSSEVPLFWKFRKSATDPAPVDGSLIPR